MASGSESDSQRENISSSKTSIAPPRLPPPLRLQLSHIGTSNARPWTSSSDQHSLPPLSEISALEVEAREHRAAGSRHLRLPPLDTSQASHRPLSGDQLPSVNWNHYPSKRRRVEQQHGGDSPNLVSRSELTADSSRLRKHADARQDPVCNQSRIKI
jgi:hypothetical protein